MRRLTSSARSDVRFLSGLAVIVCSSCGVNSRQDPGRYLPDPGVAVQAVEKSLQAWQASPDIERTTTAIRPIMFVDQRQPAGQRLRGFVILGESPGNEGYRRFLVKLSLEHPEESIVVSYLVFGQGPIWVYRAEDFDMIMHMDKSMMADPPPGKSSGTETGTKTSP